MDAQRIDDEVARVRATFDAGLTRSAEWRERKLDALLTMLDEREQDFVDALSADLGRPPTEGWVADIKATVNDIGHMRSHVAKWMKPEKVRPPLSFALTKPRILREPLGTVLVISPWNYPVQLNVLPIASAVAAGNTVVVKPSELAPKTSRVLAELLPEYLGADTVAVVEGAVEETTHLLGQPWDHILYTGNGTVGRIVARAAAEHLTPVTLELGGKSPAIVAADANIDVTAARLAFGKFLNAGQTCIAPDYVLVDEKVHDELVDAVVAQIAEQRGDDPRLSPDFGRIVNERHAERLQGLLDAGGYGAVACGGDVDVAARYVAPTVLADTERDAAVMGQEIFGPILPVIKVAGVDDAIAYVNQGDKPLALYVFTDSSDTADRVLAETSSGGACVNDAMTHALVPNLPFGGVGESGMGAYHGRAGFETFSHRKSVMERPTWMELKALYPPYTSFKNKLLRKLL